MEDVKEKMSVRQSGRKPKTDKMYRQIGKKSRFLNDHSLSVTGFNELKEFASRH